jgi:hypothetical protein
MLFLKPAARKIRLFFPFIFSLLTLALLMNFLAGAAAGQATPPVTGQQEPALAEALAKLQAHEDEFAAGRVAPWVRPLITEVKHGMRGLIVEELSRPRPAGEVAAEIRGAILRRFGKTGLRRRKDAGQCLYCYAHGFDVQAELLTRRRPELLAVVLKIDIPWGDDSSLYVFERRGRAWANVLASEINDYESVEDSQSRFRYRVSPTAADGRWFVVTGSVNNHEASAWHWVRFAALAPSAEGGPLRPTVLAHERRTIYLAGFDDETRAYRFRVAPGGFSVSFPTDAKPEGEIWARYAYEVVHGEARAKPPVCHMGRVRGRVYPCPD